MIKVLFVCLGNICRSPMAEFILKQMVADKGGSDKFEIDSAGTDGFNERLHLGMDCRAMDELEYKGVPFFDRPSRQVRADDYAHFDYILAMDRQNIYSLLSIFGSDKEHKVHRLLDFTDEPKDVRDPWYTGDFDECYWDLFYGCQAFLETLKL